MADKYPNVVCLQLHEQNCQQVLYEEGEEVEALVRAQTKKTTLTGYFELVAQEVLNPLSNEMLGSDPVTGTLYPSAADLTYLDIPTFYVWNEKNKKWTRRKRPKKSDAIGRIYTAHPNSGERFYLRMLLCKVRGASSYESLRTVEGTVFNTFKDACRELGLLADDKEWKDCLQEAAMHLGPRHLRQLFVTILFNNQPNNPYKLWNMKLDDGNMLKCFMSDDFRIQRAQLQQTNRNSVEEADIQCCLHTIQEDLLSVSNGSMSLEHFGIPLATTPRHELHIHPPNQLFNAARQEGEWRSAYAAFNDDQLQAFNEIDSAVSARHHKIFFLSAVGGTGKTFLFNSLLAKWRSKGKVVIAVASTGIAALLLQNATTVHSAFKVPLQIMPGSACSISARSDQGRMLLQSQAILWDEATMSGKDVVDCVNQLFQSLTGNKTEPFGGKVVVFGGDFRQTLPVVGKRQGRAGIVSKTIQKCDFWPSVQLLRLTINERVRQNGNDDQAQRFSNFLLQIGEGKVPFHPELGPNIVRFPDEYVFHGQNLQDFISWCYPDIHQSSFDVTGRAILAPKNSHVDEVNEAALSMMQGELFVFESADSVRTSENETEAALFPVEYLNSITASGLPPHRLCIKVGSPLILLRNMNPKQGLCNGTRLVTLQVLQRLLKVKIMNGSHAGKETWIPRIDHVTAENLLPFTMNRRQFPVKLAFAMTINKSQGQSLQHTGLWLPEPVFAHGQLYVALSRCGIPANTKVLLYDVRGKQGRFWGHEGWHTKNVVYQEVLDNCF